MRGEGGGIRGSESPRPGEDVNRGGGDLWICGTDREQTAPIADSRVLRQPKRSPTREQSADPGKWEPLLTIPCVVPEMGARPPHRASPGCPASPRSPLRQVSAELVPAQNCGGPLTLAEL